MKSEAIKTALIDVLTEIQTCSGRGVPQMQNSTCPIGGLEGFDSLNMVETASLLSTRLGYKVKPKVLLSANARQPLTIEEMVTRISQINQ